MNKHRFLATIVIAATLTGFAAAQSPAQRGGRGGNSTGPGASGFGGGGFSGGEFAGGRGGGEVARPLQRPEKVAEDLLRTYGQYTEQSLAGVPKREFKVVKPTEAVATKLFRADPKLLQNKFVGTFTVLATGFDAADPNSWEAHSVRGQLEGPGGSRGPRGGRTDEYHGDLLPLITWDGEKLFHVRPGFGSHSKLDEYFKLLVEHTPADQLPPEPIVKFLTSPDCNRDVHRNAVNRVMRGTTSVNAQGTWQFTVYGTTAAEVEARVAGILQLLDAGMSRPIQRNLLKQGQAYLAEAKKSEEAIAAQNEAIRTEQERLAKPSEISPDILSQLKAQKVMVAVELAGLIARVKACDEMLKDPKKLEISTLQSISDMKVKAEIERVGIKEKLDQINTFIGEGDGREAAQARLLTAENRKRSAQTTLRNHSSAANDWAQLIAFYAPLQLDQNEITISPVEWTN